MVYLFSLCGRFGGEIPFNCLLQPLVKIRHRLKTKFSLSFGDIKQPSWLAIGLTVISSDPYSKSGELGYLFSLAPVIFPLQKNRGIQRRRLPNFVYYSKNSLGSSRSLCLNHLLKS